jgi:hypothetical protein
MDAHDQSNKIDRLHEIQEGLEYIINEPKVSLFELMNDDFITKNTDFETFERMLNRAGVKSKNDFEDPNFSSFVKSHTRFADWEEMLIQAGNQYAYRHMGD